MVIEDDATGDVETSGVFNPVTGGIDFYESLAGMRVQVNDAVGVGATSDFGEIPLLADDGANASLRTPRGGIVVRASDFNPEWIILDDALMSVPNVNGSLPSVASGGREAESSSLSAGPGELSVATLNVENFDPGDGAAKFSALAEIVVNRLNAPDLLSLEEVQDNNGPTNDSVVDASLTLQTLVSAISAAGGATPSGRSTRSRTRTAASRAATSVSLSLPHRPGAQLRRPPRRQLDRSHNRSQRPGRPRAQFSGPAGSTPPVALSTPAASRSPASSASTAPACS